MNIHRALGHIFAASGQTRVVAVAPEPSQGAAEHQGLGWGPEAWTHLGISHLGLSLSSALQRGTSHCRLLPWAAAPRAGGHSGAGQTGQQLGWWCANSKACLDVLGYPWSKGVSSGGFILPQVLLSSSPHLNRAMLFPRVETLNLQRAGKQSCPFHGCISGAPGDLAEIGGGGEQLFLLHSSLFLRQQDSSAERSYPRHSLH